MIPLNQKKHCANYIQLTYPQNPFKGSHFQNVPTSILRHKFISFLTFREQSSIVSHISKSFNELVNFAREFQDWEDHVVDAGYRCMDPDSHIYFNQYLQWQQLKHANKTIDVTSSNPFIDILQKKIRLIKRIINVKSTIPLEDKDKQVCMETFLSLPENEPIKVKKLCLKIKGGEFFKSDLFFELFSKICPELEFLDVYFSNDNSSTRSIYSDLNFNGLSNLLLKCEHININILELSSESDLTYLSKSVEKCISLDQNFKAPFHSINLTNLSLNQNCTSIFEHCSQLKYFYASSYGDNIVKLNDHFLYSLSKCTQLETIIFESYIFESDKKDSNMTLLYDQAYANLFHNCNHMKYFLNYNFISLGDSTFNSIISHPNLKTVDMAISPSIKIFENTSVCKSLKRFRMRIFENREQNLRSEISSNTNTVLLAAAKFFPNLKEFTVYNNSDQPIQLDDQAIVSLTSLSQLKKIDLGYIQSLSSNCIIALGNHMLLKYLKFEISNLSSINSSLKDKFILKDTIYSRNTTGYGFVSKRLHGELSKGKTPNFNTEIYLNKRSM